MGPKECVFICCLYFNSLHYSSHQIPPTNQLQHVHKIYLHMLCFHSVFAQRQTSPESRLRAYWTMTCVFVLAQPSTTSVRSLLPNFTHKDFQIYRALRPPLQIDNFKIHLNESIVNSSSFSVFSDYNQTIIFNKRILI